MVLCTGLLVGGGIYSATRMPSSVYPEVTFPRIAVVAKVPNRDVVTNLLRSRSPGRLEEAVTGASSASRRCAPRRSAAAAKSPSTSRPAPNMPPAPSRGLATSQRRPLRHAARHQPDHRADVALRLSHPDGGVDWRRQSRATARLRLLRIGPPAQKNPRREVRGGWGRRHPRDRGDLPARGFARPRSVRRGPRRPDQSANAVLQPVGRVEQQPLAFQLLVNDQVKTAGQVEDLVISTSSSKTQPIRVQDVAGRQDFASGPHPARSATTSRTRW